MRRCHPTDVDDLCRYLCASCGMDSDGGSAAPGDVYGGIQLSADMDGNVAFVYCLLSERKLVEAVQGRSVMALYDEVYDDCRYIFACSETFLMGGSYY